MSIEDKVLVEKSKMQFVIEMFYLNSTLNFGTASIGIPVRSPNYLMAKIQGVY